MKVQAAVTRAKHSDMSIETLTLEEPRSGEILVRLVATGVCHTDIAMLIRHFPCHSPSYLATRVQALSSGSARRLRKSHPAIMF